MKKLGNKTVIQQTYDSVVKSNLFDKVFVVTDSKLIFNDFNKNKLNVLYSKTNHECGTDRIAEFCHKLDSEIIFNVQGDEPFIDKNGLISGKSYTKISTFNVGKLNEACLENHFN